MNSVGVHFDGVAVYRNDAILPQYLVVYQYTDTASVFARGEARMNSIALCLLLNARRLLQR